MSKIYNEGLKLINLNELVQLENELIEIKNYWDTHELISINEIPNIIHWLNNDIFLKEHLSERWNFVMVAVQIAKENGAILTIS